jgi:hypothetical protein
MNQGQIMTVDSYTKLLLSMNGKDASTYFEDSGVTGHTITAVGNVQLDTNYKKFGSASGMFDGSGDYLTIPDHADFDFSGGIFTIDCWIYYTGIGATSAIYAQTEGNNALNIIVYPTKRIAALFNFSDITQMFLDSGINQFELNTWTHIAVVENGNNYYLFINGVLTTQDFNTHRLANMTTSILIGYLGYNGWIDEFRVSKGIARWTANFIPPTNEYTVSTGTILNKDTTYTEAEIPELQFTQSADILFIAHPNHLPAKLSRTSHVVWTLEDCIFKKAYNPSVGMLTGNFDSYSLGGEKVTNGSFDLDASWDKGAGWTIADGVATRVAGTSTFLSQNTGEIAGEIYKVTYTLVKTAGTGIQVGIGGVTGTQRTTSGTYTEYIAAINDYDLGFWPTSDFAGTIDNVYVQKATSEDYSNCIDDDLGTMGYNNDIDGINSYLEINVGEGKTIELIGINLYIASSNLNATYDIEYYSGTAWIKVITGWDLSDQGLGWCEKEWASVGAKQRWRILKTNIAQSGGDVMEIEFMKKGNPKEWEAGKYPACITFFEQRLWLAYLDTLWASKSADYFNFTFGTNDDDALQYTIGSNQVNKIQWLSPGKILIIGTSGSEFKVSASSLDEALTPLNVRIVNQSFYGSTYHQAFTINDVTLFITRSLRKIREFTYSFENDAYVSPDLTLLADHLFNSDIKYMAFQQEPYSCLWVVMNNGMLLGFTYQRLEGITAWHRHTTDGCFENVACIPNTIGKGYDELWTVVKRNIGEVDVRYIEMMEEKFGEESLNSNNAFFVDSGLSYSGVPISIINGLAHLNGRTVAVLADGLVQTSKIVSGGSITLDVAASKANVGLPYTSILQTMRIERKEYSGTAQGRKKRINQIMFRLYKTKQFKYSSTPEETLKEKIFDILYSGDYEVDFTLGWDKEGYVTIVHDQPSPCTIIAIVPEVEIN